MVAAAAAMMALLPSGLAAAHSTAVASWPAPGQVVTSAPDSVTVKFSTDVMPQVDIAVVGPDGSSLALGKPLTVGPYVTQQLRPSDEAGTYVAAFHVVASDLHPILTRVEFAVDPDGTATANPAGAAPELDVAAEETPASRTSEPSSSGQLVLLAGIIGVVALTVALRVAVARRSAPDG